MNHGCWRLGLLGARVGRQLGGGAGSGLESWAEAPDGAPLPSLPEVQAVWRASLEAARLWGGTGAVQRVIHIYIKLK